MRPGRGALRRDWQLIVLCLPALLYLAIFDYAPLWGVQIAFKRYALGGTILGAPWAGLENFVRFLRYPYFGRLMGNTLGLAFWSLAIPFPLTILFAIVINSTENGRVKRVYQTIVYAPHFISVVVLMGMIYILFDPNGGLVNTVVTWLGSEPIFFLSKPRMAVPLLVGSHVWQSCGWSSILYLATLSSVPPELHESAMIDGASRLRRILAIDIPIIVPTMVTILILRIGQLLAVDWQKVLLLQNTFNMRVTEILQTYVYKTGILQGDYAYAAAAGLFLAVINLALILTANSAARAVGQYTLW